MFTRSAKAYVADDSNSAIKNDFFIIDCLCVVWLLLPKEGAVVLQISLHMPLGGLEIGRLVTKRDVVVEEIGHNGVVIIGHHEPHLSVLLGDDGHLLQIVDIYIARA